MKLEELPLEAELKEGLIKYARDNNISPLSFLESLVEDFLIKKEYLIICDVNTPVEFPSLRRLKYTLYRKSKYTVRKEINKKTIVYGTIEDYNLTKTIIEFLISKNWDLKYSTSETGFRGQKQIDFLVNEMKKEGFETEF